MRLHCGVLGFGLFCVLAGPGCSKDPEVLKREYVKRADQHLGEKKYPEAVIEYRNAVQQDPRFGEARFKLAEALRLSGDARGALREYVRAADLLPKDFMAQLRAAEYLVRSGRYEDAMARAEKALAINPKSADALITKGAAHVGLRDFDAAVAEAQDAVALDPDRAELYTSLALMQVTRGGSTDAANAEAALTKAVAVDPRSIHAKLALASFYWSTRRLQQAETTLQEAIAIAPRDVTVNRALSTLYQSTNRPALAEPHLKIVADDSKDTRARFALADYYAASKRPDEAVKLLEALAESDKTAYAAAKSRVAKVQYNSGAAARAHQTVDEVIRREPRSAIGFTTKAQFLFAEGRLDDALRSVQSAIALDPRSAASNLLLGRIQLARREPQEAITALQAVTKLSPRFWPAKVDLARAFVLARRHGEATAAAEEVLKEQPANADALLLRARALIASGHAAKAEPDMRKLSAEHPKASAVQAQIGTMHVANREYREARGAFERSVAVDPTQLEALTGLVTLDLVEKQPAQATRRIDAALARKPRDTGLMLLAGRTYATAGDLSRAETILKKAIEVNPSAFQAYSLLGQLYVRQKKLPQAISEFEHLAKQRPKSVGAPTLVAMLLQAQGKTSEARQRYERVLQTDPRAAVAANNLAWLYAEQGERLDTALQLAQAAKAQLPGRAEVDDTLGWVYLKKDLATLAVRSFQESIEKDPKNPSFHYHLGLAYEKTGDPERARQALEQALALNPNFNGADHARKTLQSLKG
jgi:tetratricopeptide (TPR) repeat protein